MLPGQLPIVSLLQHVEQALGTITGQAPVRTKARKSIAGFKLREGMPDWCKGYFTKKKKCMNFLDKLINLLYQKHEIFRGLLPIRWKRKL